MSDERTTVLFDVRLPEEYAAGHVVGSRNVPGGQLVQATDESIATLGCRLVLIDGGDAVRAPMTASWLVQIGATEAFVLEGGTQAPGVQLSSDAFAPAVLPIPDITAAPAFVTGDEFDQLLAGGSSVTVLDMSPSAQYRRGHIPKALWVSRSVLCGAAAPAGLPQAETYVLTDSNGGHRAARTVADVARLRPSASVVALQGGTAAFSGTLETGDGACVTPASSTGLVWTDAGVPGVRSRGLKATAAFEAYLAWEHSLCAQVRKDGDAAWLELRY